MKSLTMCVAWAALSKTPHCSNIVAKRTHRSVRSAVFQSDRGVSQGRSTRAAAIERGCHASLRCLSSSLDRYATVVRAQRGCPRPCPRPPWPRLVLLLQCSHSLHPFAIMGSDREGPLVIPQYCARESAYGVRYRAHCFVNGRSAHAIVNIYAADLQPLPTYRIPVPAMHAFLYYSNLLLTSRPYVQSFLSSSCVLAWSLALKERLSPLFGLFFSYSHVGSPCLSALLALLPIRIVQAVAPNTPPNPHNGSYRPIGLVSKRA